MNIDEALSHLKRLSTLLEEQGYSGTSGWVKHVETNLRGGLLTSDDWEDTIDSFKIEYTKGDAFKTQLFEVIEEIIVQAIISKTGFFKDKLLELFPFIHSWSESQKNLRTLGEFFLKLDNKEKLYGLCIAYLIEVEGSYDEVIRVLYSLKQHSLGNEIPVSDIEKMSLKELKDKFVKLGVYDVLFEGYNRNLRNAIAHAFFVYDEEREKMDFKDYYRGTEKWKGSLNYSELLELLNKLNDVDHVFTQIIMLLRVHDIIKKFMHS